MTMSLSVSLGSGPKGEARNTEDGASKRQARDQKLVRKMMKEQYVGSSMSDFGRAADHDKVGHDRVLYNVHVDASVCAT